MKPDKETLAKWLNDPNNWKWGLFYYNKEDKRIFPPKRMPAFGWTINFGNKKSIFAFVVLILLLITITRLLSK